MFWMFFFDQLVEGFFKRMQSPMEESGDEEQAEVQEMVNSGSRRDLSSEARPPVLSYFNKKYKYLYEEEYYKMER